MKKRRNFGSPPGSIKYNGIITDTKVIVDYLDYDENKYSIESSIDNGELNLHASDTNKVQWYDIRGLHDEDIIRAVAERFEMHPIAIESAVDTYQRPNHTEYKNGHFISLKVLSFDNENMKINSETLNLYFGDGYIITFQEKPNDTLSIIRQRIIESKGRIRSRKTDYLVYSIIDFVVDHYFQVLDAFEEEVEALEESIGNATDNLDKSKIYGLKKELLKIRKSVAPLREAINLFSRSDSPFVEEQTNSYIRDVYDHTIHVIDNIDSTRDILSGLQDLYISEISLKMNKIMQFLTIVTALFVPISFLTGLYGMNFEYIPELKYRNGYFVLWGVMASTVLLMLYYFRKNKWL